MVFFEYEYMLEDIGEIQKEQKKQEEQQRKEQDEQRASYKMPNMSSYMNSLPKIQMPKL